MKKVLKIVMMLVTCVAAAAYSSNGVHSRNITLYVMGGGKMILSHHGINSVKRGGGDFVKVGGIKYPYKKIGSRYWTTVSLRNMTDHAIMPASRVPDDGMLYQYYYVHREIVPMLPAGWRIPTEDDFSRLTWETSGSHAPQAEPYIAVDKGGTDLYGLNIKLLGYRSNIGVYSYTNQRSVIWSQDTAPNSLNPSKFCGRLILNDLFQFNVWSNGTEDYLESSAMEVRICKDAD